MLANNTILQDRYRIIEQIGRGGMGAVYKAVDVRLQATVALKQTLVEGEPLRKAFEREAQMLASLHHPTLPSVSDHFIDQRGQFLVMEYIPSDDFGTLLQQRQQPFALNDVLRWANQLLDALDYLHSRTPQIVHRDIKPQNLKLTDRGDIILLDFGLAKGSAVQTRVTSTGSIFGYTPHYAPVEQIHGTGTDRRSDLYALGATLYHLLTLVTPVDAVTRATSKVNDEPDPLVPIRALNPAVPLPIAAVIEQAMAQKASQRPDSAIAMRTALQQAPGGNMPVPLVIPDDYPAPSDPTVRHVAGRPAKAFAAPSTAVAAPTMAAGTVSKRMSRWLIIAAPLLLVIVAAALFAARTFGAAAPLAATTQAIAVALPTLPASFTPEPTTEATLEQTVASNVDASTPSASAPTELAQQATAQPIAAPVRLQPQGIRASGEAPPGKDRSGNTISYSATNAIDGQPETTWRVAGDGIGQTLTLTFPTQIRVNNVQILPGYAKIDQVTGEDRFSQNRRVLRVRLTFDDGSAVEGGFQETPSLQAVPIGDAVTRTVTIEVLETSEPATKDGRDFTPISEIVVNGIVCDNASCP